MANDENNWIPITKINEAMLLLKQGLDEIAECLKLDPPAVSPRIDEVLVMKSFDMTHHVWFAYTEGYRQVLLPHFQEVIDGVMEHKHGNVVKLDSQDGEKFDFLVSICFKANYYFVLGNYMAGSYEDLEQHENWNIAKSQFVALAAKLIKTILDWFRNLSSSFGSAWPPGNTGGFFMFKIYLFKFNKSLFSHKKG